MNDLRGCGVALVLAVVCWLAIVGLVAIVTGALG